MDPWIERLKAYGWQLAFFFASASALGLVLALCFANGDRKALRKDRDVAVSQLAQCRVNEATLQSGLDRQNEAVKGLERDRDAKAQAVKDARQEAAREAAGFRKTIARLQAAKPAGDVCVAARSLIVETLGDDR